VFWATTRNLLIFTLASAAIACGGAGDDGDGALPHHGSADDADSDSSGPGESGPNGDDLASEPQSLEVRLVPRVGAAGVERVNFAVPLPPGLLGDETEVRVLQDGIELPSARRGLARRQDGSLRSVQIQVEPALSGDPVLEVRVGEPASAGDLDIVPVAETLESPDGTAGPRVWAILPPAWLSASGAFGPQVPEAEVEGTALAAWSELCDYDGYDTSAFLDLSGDGAVWLYDRGTVMYRGHARRGDLGTLESAYRETAIYRAGITGSGDATDIGVPGKSGDLKYFYAQNMAIHYLLSGDERFRESAEQIAARMTDLWSPVYAGDDRPWTERRAGFLLLAYQWASAVSDDRAEHFAALADEAVAAFLGVQDTYPLGYDDGDARCFAHAAAAHAEDFGTWGCSPWMSAILADGLDAYASERTGAPAERARAALVKLGRMIAENGRDAEGRPYYWMGVGTDQHELDEYDEHWGEAAYLVAMAWHHGGRKDTALRSAAGELLDGLRGRGAAPHMRSFNWQCRSAVATPYYLLE